MVHDPDKGMVKKYCDNDILDYIPHTINFLVRCADHESHILYFYPLVTIGRGECFFEVHLTVRSLEYLPLATFC